MPDVEYRPDVSQIMTQALNNSQLNNTLDPGAFRKPDYFVYVYSVANRSFERNMPPHMPRLILPACPPDKEYIEVAKVAHPFEQADRDVDNGEVRMRYHDARKIAQDIVCPNAPDMDTPVPADSHGIDFRAKGVFWSLNNPPKPEEVAKAHKRVEKYYRALLEKAVALEYTNPKELYERLNEDYHLAADYFGEEYSWHKARVQHKKPVVVAKVDCPFCGESIKAGVAFHKGEDGELCILDWERAFKAGKVTKRQYEDFQANPRSQ